MAFHRQQEWQPLLGQNVIIKRDGDVVRHGRVDAVTPDDQILWLDVEGTEPRRLFERSEGFEAWIAYKWEAGEAAAPDALRLG
ncbi:hypothetical protein C9424_16815 [Arthrobacter sp. H-02-3]|nr:hypothetical protein C9424_16815 [Arthrobacter sp. H-02-3]